MKWWPPKEWPLWKRIHGVFEKQPPSLYELRPFAKPISDMAPATVLLFSSDEPSLLRKLIQGVTNARVCHAGMYFGSGRHEVIEADPEGVARNTLDARLKSKSEMIWAYAYKPMTVIQLQIIKAYCNGRIGVKYDYVTLLDFVLGGDHSSESRVICSELVVLAFKEISVQICPNKYPGKVSPGDLQNWFTTHPAEWELFDTQNVKKS